MTGYLITFLDVLATALYIAILARVIVSWIPIGPDSRFAPIVRTIYQITEPILAPIRRLLPSMGMFDLSPMIAILVIILVQALLIPALARL